MCLPFNLNAVFQVYSTWSYMFSRFRFGKGPGHWLAVAVAPCVTWYIGFQANLNLMSTHCYQQAQPAGSGCMCLYHVYIACMCLYQSIYVSICVCMCLYVSVCVCGITLSMKCAYQYVSKLIWVLDICQCSHALDEHADPTSSPMQADLGDWG
jgi:hypothetical protein